MLLPKIQANADYHVHTDHSHDCMIPMAAMCNAALETGLSEIAFTDHFNNHPLDLDLGFYNAESYFETIEACRSSYPTLRIIAGIEVGEPHRWWDRIAPVLEEFPYDVVLGSLHWVGRSSVFSADYYKSQPEHEAYGRYFRELREMIEFGGFDILAHVDVVKRVGCNVYRSFNTAALEDLIRPVWEACIHHNITPEINTKGLRTTANAAHPAALALAWYAAMGGERLTFGSDAHQPESIGQGFDVARDMALRAGLTHLCHFQNRRIIAWSSLA